MQQLVYYKTNYVASVLGVTMEINGSQMQHTMHKTNISIWHNDQFQHNFTTLNFGLNAWFIASEPSSNTTILLRIKVNHLVKSRLRENT